MQFHKLILVFCLIQILSCSNPLGGTSSADVVSGPTSSISFAGIQSITDLGGLSIRLNWISNSSATYYNIYEVSNATVTLVGLVSAPASSYVISGLSPATTYKYRVRAADADGIVETNSVSLPFTTSNILPVAVTSISPAGDDLVGGSTVQLTGTGFQSGATAYIDNIPCAASNFISATQINCVTPSGIVAANTFVNVKVINSDSGVSTLVSSFKYINAVSCLNWKNLGYNSSGNFKIDHDNNSATARKNVSCDQVTDGGGWTAILNYVHKAGTNPVTTPLASTFPIVTAASLGTDESLVVASWGHVDGSFLTALSFTDIRFYCKTSGHTRTVDFKTAQVSCLSYLKTGSGGCTTVGTASTLLTAHTAIHVPQLVNGTVASSATDAITNFPFYNGGAGHWGIRGLGNRWECDDYPAGPGLDTLHRAWIR
jgi:IPT/TIG domain